MLACLMPNFDRKRIEGFHLEFLFPSDSLTKGRIRCIHYYGVHHFRKNKNHFQCFSYIFEKKIIISENKERIFEIIKNPDKFQ